MHPNDGAWRVETSTATFDVHVVDGKVIDRIDDYGLHIVGWPFETLKNVSRSLTRLAEADDASDNRVVEFSAVSVPKEGWPHMPRRRADFDPDAAKPIAVAPGQTNLDEQIAAAAGLPLLTNGAAHEGSPVTSAVMPEAPVVPAVKPDVTKIVVNIKRVVWTENPRGTWEITAGVEAVPDKNGTTGVNLDRLKALCHAKIDQWIPTLPGVVVDAPST